MTIKEKIQKIEKALTHKDNKELLEYYQEILEREEQQISQCQENLLSLDLLYKRNGCLKIVPLLKRKFNQNWVQEQLRENLPPPPTLWSKIKQILNTKIPSLNLRKLKISSFLMLIILGIIIAFYVNYWKQPNLITQSGSHFGNFQYAQLSSLREHTKILQQFVKAQKNKISFSDYSKTEPLVNQQKMFHNIYQSREYPIDTLNESLTGGSVRTLDFNPSSLTTKLQLLAGTDDGKLIFFDDISGGNSNSKVINSKNNHVTNIRYNDQGKYIAVAAKEQNKRIQLYENIRSESKPIHRDNVTDDTIGKVEIKSLSFDPSGKYLVAGDDNGKITLFEVEETGNNRAKLSQRGVKIKHGETIEAIEFIPKSEPKIFATAGSVATNKEEIYLWDLTNSISCSNTDQCEPKIKIKTPFVNISSISFNPNGKLMAIVGKTDNSNSDEQNKLCLKYIDDINGVDGQEIMEVQENKNCKPITKVKKVVFSSEEEDIKKQLIATTSDNGDIDIWNYKKNSDLIEKALLKKIHLNAHYKDISGRRDGKRILSIQFSQDTKYLASSGADGKIKIWKISKLWNNDEIETLIENSKTQSKHKFIDIGLANSEEKEGRVIFIDNDNKTQIIDIESGETEIREGDSRFVKSSDIKLIKNRNRNEYYFLLINEDHVARFYNLSAEENKRMGDNGGINLPDDIDIDTIKVYGNEKYFGLIDQNSQLSVWNGQGKLHVKNQRIDNSKVVDIQISEDGNYFIAKSENDQLTRWKISSANKSAEEQEIACKDISRNITAFKISPDNSIFVVATDRGNINVCNLQNGDSLDLKNSSGRFHSQKIRDLQFSFDGKYLVSLDKNNKAILWEITPPKGNKTAKLKKLKEENNVNTIRISPEYPDGMLIAMVIKTPNDNNPNENKNKIKLWDTIGRDIAEYKTGMDKIEYLRFTPFRNEKNDENYIVASDDKGNVKAWEINNVQKLIDKSCKWLKEGNTGDNSFNNNCSN